MKTKQEITKELKQATEDYNKGDIGKMIFFNSIKDTIIEDQISTIKRLQRELDERTDFEVKLMNYILELLKTNVVKLREVDNGTNP